MFVIQNDRFRFVLGLSGVLAFAFLCGGLFKYFGLPLPWMIGPIIGMAMVYGTDLVKVRIPVTTRPVAQATVSAQIGLYFTPAALQVVHDLAPVLGGAAILTATWALCISVIVTRFTGNSFVSSLLATIPTGPVEAANLGEAMKCETGPIILAQTLRISATVVLIPTAFFIFGQEHVGGLSTQLSATTEFSPTGFVLLAVAVAAGALVFKKLRIANPFFLGPLFASACLAAAGISLSSIPYPVLAAAQVVMGAWLGSNLRPDLFRRAGHHVVVSICSTLALLSLCALTGFSLSLVADADWRSLILGTGPGGTTEMALTARALNADVVLVAAMQITRIFIITPLVPLIVRAHSWFKARRS